MKNKRGVVFGSFDDLHKGHEYFLKHAQEYCDELIAIIAPDECIEHYKKRIPYHSQEQRRSTILATNLVNDAVIGDPLKEQGNYAIIQRLQPDCIIFGYDQQDLQKDLESWYKQHEQSCEMVVLNAYQPDIYKTSLR